MATIFHAWIPAIQRINLDASIISFGLLKIGWLHLLLWVYDVPTFLLSTVIMSTLTWLLDAEDKGNMKRGSPKNLSEVVCFSSRFPAYSSDGYHIVKCNTYQNIELDCFTTFTSLVGFKILIRYRPSPHFDYLSNKPIQITSK